MVNVIWSDAYNEKWRTICLDTLLRRIESIFSQVRIFTEYEFTDVFIKSDTNYSDNPAPVLYRAENMPEYFNATDVLRKKLYYYNTSQSDVRCTFTFLVKGFRETTRERFAEKIRQIIKRMNNLSPNSKRGSSLGFFYNEKDELNNDKKISKSRDRGYDFSTNYPFCLEPIDDIYNAITNSQDDSNTGRRTYYRNIYDENPLKEIIQKAIKKAGNYSMIVKLCKVFVPNRENFMFDGNAGRDNNKAWASMIVNAAPGVPSIDVKNIEEWVINEIMAYVDNDYIDLVKICFALKCMCKVTDNQLEEVVNKWKEKHNDDRMSHDDKKYVYNEGTSR